MNALDLLRETTNFIHLYTKQSITESKIEAEEILMHVLGISKTKIYLNEILQLTEILQDQINNILNKRKNDVPLSYILKKHLFYKNSFYIDENVLIPRSETENIIDDILLQGDKIFKRKKRCFFLDAGCGSGCVGITIACERPLWNVFLSDAYPNTLGVAKTNMKLCKTDNIQLIAADWLLPFQSKAFDFIFSNPPYIANGDIRIDKSVVLNEPKSALFSGKDGLRDIKTIIKTSKDVLSHSGVLFIENGVGQSKKISHLLELNDFTDISIHLDYNGHERFTSSHK